MRPVIRISNIAFATLLLGLLLFASQSVQAVPTVTNTLDAGAGSLRQAILDATAGSTIDFNINPLTDPGYNSATDRFTITLASSLPDISVVLTIDNTMVSGVTVNGGSFFRVFTLANSTVVVINNLTISNGNSNLPGDLAKGGGIFMGNSSTLTLNNCIVSGNTATLGGGGIWMNDSSTLHIFDSTISDNTTNGGDGGGIRINTSGTLNITSSTVSGNHAPASAGGGGGIYNGVTGTVNATNITVNGNTAGNQGGGINNTATLTVNSSTISGNTATVGGGGIFNGATATLSNSLVALNTSADGPDLKGAFTANFCLIGNAAGSTFSGANNQLGTITTLVPINPLLGPLQDNGGPTFTRALLAGSPAIDTGASSPTLSTDQRGVTRPKDGDGVGGAQDDIGSFELDPAAPTPTAPLVVIGSSGTVDESDLTEYEVRNQFATIKDSVIRPGTVVVTYRYNVPAVGNLEDGTGPFTIRIRYRDTGAAQNVIVRLRGPSLGADGVTTIYTFNSDSGSTGGGVAGPNVNANQTFDECSVTLPGDHIVHGRYGYFLEVVITKTANDGTASPGFIGFVMSGSGITDVTCGP